MASYNSKTFKRLLNRPINYIKKRLTTKVGQREFVLTLRDLNYFDNISLSFINDYGKIIERVFNTIDYTDRVIRPHGEKWTSNDVTDLLLKVFDAYDFEKLRYNMDKKLIISKQYSVNQVRLTDQVNLFINEALDGNDKYNILSVIDKSELVKWRYRNLVKENLNEVDLPYFPEEYRDMISLLFYKK